ncbi:MULTISPECIES: STAS domain-containing protein [Kitasatospora]|uniref:Anti-anti-sigma factor n=2 Tax=Kitasatospora TaxID=2063 RepID=A0ABT1J3M9_9ACTN|nr:STAS domain-containing protein [Kitasatospora paracochleata]MCP2311671.1 anti-anti-sigma factor [Kitasatospora paracochleata]
MTVALRVDRRTAPSGVRLLALDGEADFDTAGVLAGALHRALTDEPVPLVLVVDCSRLEFCSSAGLNELLRARKAALDGATAFRLAGPSAQLARLLALTGTDAVFRMAPPPARPDRPSPAAPTAGPVTG